jgi:hypothetical protein
MSIVTKGYGVGREAIITKGYGRNLEQVVVEAIEEIVQRRVGGSGAKRKRIIEDEKLCDEYTISVSLTKLNDSKLLDPIKGNITKCINDFDANIDIRNISVQARESDDVEIVVELVSKKKKRISVTARQKK